MGAEIAGAVLALLFRKKVEKAIVQYVTIQIGKKQIVQRRDTSYNRV